MNILTVLFSHSDTWTTMMFPSYMKGLAKFNELQKHNVVLMHFGNMTYYGSIKDRKDYDARFVNKNPTP